MPWTCPVLAGLSGIGWAIGLKYSDGFSRLRPGPGALVGGRRR